MLESKASSIRSLLREMLNDGVVEADGNGASKTLLQKGDSMIYYSNPLKNGEFHESFKGC